ncbi:unnamed protein product [Linum tenue]|uniref:Uncharacterized protein n=2 Tax=Linum tenue TaxID=586396 RepID=A0AAV0PMV4_9ROSI|nr:unnamed protein product [Linum tenue]
MDVGHRGAGSVEDLLVDEEEVDLGKLRSESTQETDAFDRDHLDDGGGGCESIGSSGPQPVSSNCFDKAAKFPCPSDKVSSLDSSNDDAPEEALHLLFSEEPLQAAESIKLIPALKGSREKMGKAAPRQQLSVTWAPDVYDPVPNSLCHTVKSSKKKSRREKDRDNNHHHNKKNGKKGQKGSGSTSSSRGGSSSSSSSKDKKQIRRKPDNKSSYKTLDICDDRFGDSSSGLSFDVASADYCGSSFLKKSVTEFHYSVAEAL